MNRGDQDPHCRLPITCLAHIVAVFYFMPRIQYLFSAVFSLFVVFHGVPLTAQTNGPAPTNYISDDARLIDPAGLVKLMEELRNFEQRTSHPLYVKTLTFIDGGVTSKAKCKALVDDWLPHRSGVVVCYNRAEGALPVIEFSSALQVQYSALALATVHQHSVQAMTAVKDARERLLVGLQTVMTELALLQNSTAQGGKMFSVEDSALAAAFAGLLVVGGGLGWLIIRRRHAKEALASVQIYLPEAEVGQRFGAPCGGGVLAEIHL
jgi:hypothetical protein